MVGVGGNDYGKTIRMRPNALIALGHQTIKITWFLMIFHGKCFDPTFFSMGTAWLSNGVGWGTMKEIAWEPMVSNGI